MVKQKKKKILKLLKLTNKISGILLLLCIAFAIGTFIHPINQGKSTKPAVIANTPTFTPKVITNPTLIPKPSIIPSNFQEFTHTVCPDELDESKLLIQMPNINPNEMGCAKGWSRQKDGSGWYIHYESNDLKKFFIHDGEFYDEGHGGPSLFLPHGEIVLRDNNTDYSFFINYGEFGPDEIRYARVSTRAVKQFETKSNWKFFVSYTDWNTIKEGDSELIKLLESVSAPCKGFQEDDYSNLKCYNSDQAEKQIRTRFFGKNSPYLNSLRKIMDQIQLNENY